MKRGRDRAIGELGNLTFKGRTEKKMFINETEKDQVDYQTTEECGIEDSNVHDRHKSSW